MLCSTGSFNLHHDSTMYYVEVVHIHILYNVQYEVIILSTEANKDLRRLVISQGHSGSHRTRNLSMYI